MQLRSVLCHSKLCSSARYKYRLISRLLFLIMTLYYRDNPFSYVQEFIVIDNDGINIHMPFYFSKFPWWYALVPFPSAFVYVL